MFPDITRDDVFRIETPRLWLRWPERRDCAAIRAYASCFAVADMTSSAPILIRGRGRTVCGAGPRQQQRWQNPRIGDRT